jgi:KaiC/GvpD/RAD55 family RecA-like ATPase
MASARDELNLKRDSVIYLLLVEPSDYAGATVDIIRRLLREDANIIYVSVNKPAPAIIARLKESEVDSKGIYFIDCATAAVSGETERKDKLISVAPQNLTGLSLAINELLDELKGKRAVVFDSMNTLLVYNPLATIEKFAHFTTNKIRLKNASCVLISTGELSKELLSLLEGVCDKTIEYG